MMHRGFICNGVFWVMLAVIPCTGWTQAQYPPQAGPPPGAYGPPPAQVPQQPLEYAFRPDLTNPEYGQCLQMEKYWQNLWQQYYQIYQRHRMTNPSDPAYAQLTWQAGNVKQQLDAAWNDFSSRCIYFPSRR